MEITLQYNLRPGVRNYNGTIYSGSAVQKVVELLEEKMNDGNISIVNFAGKELNGIKLIDVNSKLFTFDVTDVNDWTLDNIKVTAEIYAMNGFKAITDSHILDVSGKIVLLTNNEYNRRADIKISEDF